MSGAPPASTEDVGSPGELRVQGVALEVLEGPDQGTRFAATSDRVVIGGDRACDLVLSDEAASRFHCEITVARGRVQIADLGSRNGTSVDGVFVVRAFLHHGAILRLGRSVVRFAADDTEIRIPLSSRDQLGGMVGRSAAMRAAFALMERAAASASTVLLLGETGTGKELAARAIHAESPRSAGPFVVVDCGAVPPDLLESELFGHEKGAFTGATATRVGAFEAASGGTLFLDEIGELSLELQPKLLRALERREVKRVGANQHEQVDVRIIAATNRDLRDEVNARRFRSDLYYRLAVIEVRLPPLRERPEDLMALRDKIVADLCPVESPEVAQIVRSLPLETLARHAWPGNVRELRNYLERCIALRETVDLAVPAAATDAAAGDDAALPLRAARERWTRHYLERLLVRSDDNITAAARAAGIDRIHLYRLLRQHGLR